MVAMRLRLWLLLQLLLLLIVLLLGRVSCCSDLLLRVAAPS